MSLKSEVLQALKESDTYISGQRLSETLQVSRTAIWKAINQLKASGYTIDSVSNKGYLLSVDTKKYNQQELEVAVKGSWAGRSLLYKERMTSTNMELALIADEKPHGFCMVADEQTKGRGRRGRTWESGKQGNIYMSLLCKPEFAPEKASMLTLVMALAVSQALDDILHVETQIKWPNDIILHGKKICGILSEMRAEPDLIHHVILGVGINVNQESFDLEVLPYATSLKKELQNEVDRSLLFGAILESFEKFYEVFGETNDLSKLMPLYNQKLVSMNQDVKILDATEGDYKALATGINCQGGLMVELEGGIRKEILAGEVSVRGIYGYI